MIISAFYGSLAPVSDTADCPLDQAAVESITAAGFNTVIISLFHISAAGDIGFNKGNTVVSGGQIQTSFVNPPQGDWSYYIQQLKTNGVEKIYLSFGGFGVSDYANITSMLVNNNGVPEIPADSNLYQNMVALKTYFSMVDGIDLDQEESDSYTDAMTAFGNLAIQVGFAEVTMVPPYDTYITCYQTSAYEINKAAGSSVVTRLGLQFYGGCAAGASVTWANAAEYIGSAVTGGKPPLVYTGVSAGNSQGPSNMYNQIIDLKNTTGFSAGAGAFYWEYSLIEGENLSCYQKAIGLAFTPNSTWPPEGCS